MDDRGVLVIEHAGEAAPSFVDGEGYDPEQPGLCVGLVSYDVVARAAVGDVAEVAVVVENRCFDRDVEIHRVELLDVDGAFELIGAPPAVIPAGDEVEILVEYEALANMIHLGEVLVVTDDAVAGRQVASLFGIVPQGDGYRSGEPPEADAGPDFNVCQTGVSEPLDGSGSSDPELDSLTYRWSFKTLPGGSSLTTHSSITNDDQVNASFVPDVDGAYMVRLVVSDGTSTDKDFSQWTANSTGTNNTPVADSGGFQGVKLGQVVTCDGTGTSDADGDPLTYTWTFYTVPGTSTLTDGDISGASTSTASYTPDVEGTYALKLQVSDGITNDKDFAYANVNVNAVPNATTGPNQTVDVDTVVDLDGTDSTDADQWDTLTYAWSFKTQPGGSALTNNDITNRTSASASFTPDVVGAWRIRLTVSDGYDSDVTFTDITVQ